jgi:hypothetical protein
MKKPLQSNHEEPQELHLAGHAGSLHRQANSNIVEFVYFGRNSCVNVKRYSLTQKLIYLSHFSFLIHVSHVQKG